MAAPARVDRLTGHNGPMALGNNLKESVVWPQVRGLKQVLESLEKFHREQKRQFIPFSDG